METPICARSPTGTKPAALMSPPHPCRVYELVQMRLTSWKKKRTEPARPNQYTDAMHYISIPNSQIKSKSTLNISQIDAYHCIHSQINIHRSSEKSKSTTPLFFSLGHLASIATTRRPLPWWKKRRLDPAVPKLMLAEFDRPELKGRWIWPLAQPHPPQIDSRERETWRCGSLRVCRDTLSRRRAATL